jgi:hypothetical protein
MKMRIALTFILVVADVLAHAQAAPDATGPEKLPMAKSMKYALRYSQSSYLYGSEKGGAANQVTGVASGDMDFTRDNDRYPFILNYSGGYMWAISGPSLGTGVFQHMSVSQGVVQHRWDLLGSEDISYTPQAPVIGFSGVPGTGEPIGAPGTNPPSQTLLTLNTRTLDNLASLHLGYRLDSSTALNIGGGSQLLRFPEGNGMDTDEVEASAGLTRRLNARSSVAGQYMFSRYSYGKSPFSSSAPGSFEANTVSVDYTHSWTRNLKTDVSAGPQWVPSTNGTAVPTTLTAMVHANVNYVFRNETAFVDYNRGVTGGAGYLAGATVDTVTGGLSRIFARTLSIGVTGSYYSTAALSGTAGRSDARLGGVQASEQLGPFFSFFGSYTAVDQSSGVVPASNVLNQFYQLVSFGIAYSPREARRKK